MMQIGGPRWLFLYLVLVYVPRAGHAIWRTRIRPPVFEDRQRFVDMETTPATTPETLTLDPRAESTGR